MKDIVKFNKSEIDKILLENGFEYYEGWSDGPYCSWNEDHDSISLMLMYINYGYLIIFQRHVSGENIRMNIGESNNAEEIIRLRDILKSMAGGHLIKKKLYE